MPTINGIIEAKSNKFDKWSILVDGEWYSTKFEIKGEKGDTVAFETPEGKKYVNKLRVVSGGGGVASIPKNTGGGFAKGTFPVPLRDGSRAIIRQNSITNAVKYATGCELAVEEIIEIARKFEAYSSGDLDMAAAEDAVDKAFDTKAA